jgi:hypothetical protein
MRDDHMDRRGRWKVTGKVRVVENVGTTLGQVRGEVAWGDDVGAEERLKWDMKNTILDNQVH